MDMTGDENLPLALVQPYDVDLADGDYLKITISASGMCMNNHGHQLRYSWYV